MGAPVHGNNTVSLDTLKKATVSHVKFAADGQGLQNDVVGTIDKQFILGTVGQKYKREESHVCFCECASWGPRPMKHAIRLDVSTCQH